MTTLYHLRKLSFHNPALGTVEDFFSYTSDVYGWKDSDTVRTWAARRTNNHIADKVLSTPEFCLTVDVVLEGLNEAEAKTAKRTAIAMSQLSGNLIVNKRW